MFAGCLTLYVANVRAGRTLHKSMLHNVLQSPMAFFDTTPSGRVLNRFGKDVDVVDNTIAHSIKNWIRLVMMVCTAPIVIGMATPLYLPLLIPKAIIYFAAQVGFTTTYFNVCYDCTVSIKDGSCL